MFELFAKLSLLSAKLSFIALLVRIVVIAILVFAVIGIISTIHFFIGRKKTKETPEEKWRRTGRL